MKRILAVCLAVLCMNVPTMAKEKKITFRVIETSDVHGCFFPYDFCVPGGQCPLPFSKVLHTR